jgi:hypothetical protein
VAQRDPRTAEESTRPVRSSRTARTSRRILRNGTTRNSPCHQWRRKNLPVSGATTIRATNSATNTAHSTQPSTVSTALIALPGTVSCSPRTTRRNKMPNALIAGVSRSSSSSAQISRSV